MELKEKIIEAAFRAYKQKGLKFTMDDLAKDLSISKKTIYTIFDDKNSLIDELVDKVFQAVKECEDEVIHNDSLDTLGKVKGILAALPDILKDVDISGLYVLRDKYPTTYRKVQMHLETGWEQTISILNQGVEEGVLRPFNVALFKLMYEATLESFFTRDFLSVNHLEYHDALNQIVDIMVEGIAVKQK
jgi:AcrR family transcriptional regulator